jgi:hypothetical protein
MMKPSNLTACYMHIFRCKGRADFSEQNAMWPRSSFDQSQYLDDHPSTNLLRFLDRVPLPNIYNTGNLGFLSSKMTIKTIISKRAMSIVPLQIERRSSSFQKDCPPKRYYQKQTGGLGSLYLQASEGNPLRV